MGRGLGFEEAANLLASNNCSNGTFIVTLGPVPCVATVTVILDYNVRQINISRRLPRGFSAHNPLTGEVEGNPEKNREESKRDRFSFFLFFFFSSFVVFLKSFLL